MTKCLVDTDILSFFLRGDSLVSAHCARYLDEHSRVSFSILTEYEILSGLKHRDARKQLDSFLRFADMSEVVPLTERSVGISADLYAELRRRGEPLDDVDLLIAGIALAEDLTLVTHNRDHFARVQGLRVEDWAEG